MKENEKMYTRKDVYKIYWDARCQEITDENLLRIKNALYEIVNLCQFSKDSFEYLIETLLDFPDEVLKEIETGKFSLFYNEYCKHTNGMPEDFDYCVMFLCSMYNNYEKMASKIDFCNYKQYFLFLKDVPEIDDYYLNNMLLNVNSNLGNTILQSYKNVKEELLPHYGDSLSLVNAKNSILCSLELTFMMYLNEYDHFYELPGLTYNYVIENYSDDIIIKIDKYIKSEETEIFLFKYLLTFVNNRLKKDDYNDNHDELNKYLQRKKLSDL